MATPEDLNRVIAHIEKHYGGTLPGNSAIVASNGLIDPRKAIDQLRDLHPELFPGGQIPNSTEPPLPAPAPPPPSKLPGPGEGPPPDRTATSNFHNNFHLLDQDEYKKYRKGPKSVEKEFVSSFVDGFNGMAGAESTAGPGGYDWGERIVSVHEFIENGLTSLGVGGGLDGDAGQAIKDNLNRSLSVLDEMYRHTNSMRMLIADFLNTIGSTKQFFDDNKQLYDDAVSNPDAHPDTINQLNELTVAVFDNFYNPAIQGIAGRHPDLKQSAPRVGSPGPARMSTGPGGGGMGGPPPSKLTQKATNLGKPATPPTTEPAGPPTAPQVPADALKGLGDTAKGLGDGVQKAAGQAGDAAAGALDAALNGATQPGGTTGAVGGIGPRTTSAGHRGSGTTRGLGGGRGGGVGGVGETKPTLKSAPLTKASSAMGPAPSVSRAGLSGVGGPGGMGGAPVAGPRGDGASGVHKASKALRSAKQGDEVVGDVEAVVPVIGERADKTPPAKPAG